MIRAQLLTTQGPYLEAIVRINGHDLCLMDEFTVSAESAPDIGSEFDLELTALLDDDETWEEMFSGNPEQRIGLVPLGGWRYRAFGQITQINPIMVNCGLMQLESPVQSNDSRLTGEYIAFTVARLGGYGYAT